MNNCNEANLQHAKDTVEEFGECWLHGDGNVYHREKDSLFQRGFSNPNNKFAKSFAHFKSVSQVPEDPADLLPIFMKNLIKDEQAAVKDQSKNSNEPVVLTSKDAPVQLPKANVEDLVRTAARLDEKDALLTSREDVLDQTEVHLETKKKQLAAKENELGAKIFSLEQMSNKLKAMEEELKNREALLKKKEAAAK